MQPLRAHQLADEAEEDPATNESTTDILTVPVPTGQSPGAVRLAGNVSRDVTADLVDPARGDLHLRRAVAGAIGRAAKPGRIRDGASGGNGTPLRGNLGT
jgi:hypothetical protein